MMNIIVAGGNILVYTFYRIKKDSKEIRRA